MPTLLKNITEVKNRIAQAAISHSRNNHSVHLLAASKTQPSNIIRQAYQYSVTNFGENYLQEALEKQNQLRDLEIIWHFIGSIQSNKTRDIAENFCWAHTVDRFKIAERLSQQRPKNMPPLNICLQVNLDEESTKSGCTIEELAELAQKIIQLPRITLRGLMVIPLRTTNELTQNATFAQLNLLKQQLNLNLDTLSMGMSHDLEPAIAQGATWVRIGTAIFGKRNVKY
ncbi:UNVERIFIED_CONTAM: hypothetical protein GTU68_052141 [Idotea baltica]|nr:hypothetical protein [Idotea baltica]